MTVQVPDIKFSARHGKPSILWALLLVVIAAITGDYGLSGETPGQKVFVIPVSGDVEPGMAAFIKRAFMDAAQHPDAIFVLEMDTFGGRVDSALQIVDTLLKDPGGQTIAFVENKAISAGALIALACNELVMKPNTTIGDCAPITFSSEGAKMMGEKFQSPLRAKFRTLARKNGYPPALAEAMVTPDMIVYEVKLPGKTIYMDSPAFADLSPKEKENVLSKKTVVAKGELLTMDDQEARELSFSRMSAASIHEMLDRMDIIDYEIINIKESWSESLVRLISSIAPILLMIGMAALYTELQAPGFGVPGIVGIICLGLVFLNQYLVGLADHTELLLLVLGIVLLGVEIFVTPGFGLMGLGGMFLMGVGMVFAFQDFEIPDPSLPWQKEILIKNMSLVLGSFLAAFIFSLFFLRYVLSGLAKVIDGPYLESTLKGSVADSIEAKKVRAGDSGIAYTFLRPAGKIKIGNDLFDVISEGEFIEKGTPVIISEIRGNRLIAARKKIL
ncbi:MAG: NfeD family protein [Thermodesulfobacteriota bacterium]|nr:NfeD family protein [Thermodesulfobacteriota bacterium]